MLVSGRDPQRVADLGGPAVVLGEPLDVVVEGVQPGRGEHARLAHPAAEPLAQHPGPLGAGGAAVTTSEPTGAPRPLLRQTDRVPNTRAVGRERRAGGDGGVPDAGAVAVQRDAVRRRPAPAAPAARASGCTAPPPRLWVCSTLTAAVGDRAPAGRPQLGARQLGGQQPAGARERPALDAAVQPPPPPCS